MKDVEEHKFIWIWRPDLLFLPNANAFRKQGGAIFAERESLSRREVGRRKCCEYGEGKYTTKIVFKPMGTDWHEN